ncbi:39S ribosomal protein L52, mitochondrial [Osmerus eperlanus]|uniref:39S ribosomal protein L52, mitochondrial n=1 Tax=Osmerus eperlanus TaxID=29151 RepID=UPI002E149463
MAATIRTLCCTVFQHSSRHLSTTCCVRGGLKWRLEHGLARSGSEYGPLTDLPDWSFADGRPAPPMKGQLRRKEERETLTRRIVALETEVDKGMDQWKQKQELSKEMEVQKNSLLLKRKGNSLLKKK